MLSKRDKLLVRPWQQKRFENHRQKVLSALPAIDNKPPASREHISIKLKRKQLERERIAKIEKDNLILMRRLNYIMKTNRVDNYWENQQPNFLNRVAIYETKPGNVEINIEVPTTPHLKRSHCLACSPQFSPGPTIPEERVPWAPIKPPVSRKRSQSVPLRKLSLPTITPEEQDINQTAIPETSTSRSKSCKASERKTARKSTCYDDMNVYHNFCQSLVLNRGSLKLAVHFPRDTYVSLRDGFSEKVLLGRDCSCKALIT